MRNLILGANYVMSHILHLYHLAALDYVDPTVSTLPDAIKKRGFLCPQYDSSYFKFNAATTDYLIFQYLKALNIRRAAHELVAIWGGRAPSASVFTPGGVSSSITQQKIDQSRKILEDKLKPFIGTPLDYALSNPGTYLYDVVAVAHTYPEYFWVGNSHERFLSYGCFEEGDTDLGTPQGNYDERLLMRGRRHSADPTTIFNSYTPGFVPSKGTNLKAPLVVNQLKIREAVKKSWYTYKPAKPKWRHPWKGQTRPSPNKTGAYTWVKTPRYLDGTNLAYEVGPLARMVVNGDYYAGFLYDAGYTGTPQYGATAPSGPGSGTYVGDSVLDRHAARALECYKVAHALQDWVDKLQDLYDDDKRDGCTNPPHGPVRRGYGMTEAPRGALAHWMKTKDDKITKYQCIVPTTWNSSPKDGSGQHGATEQSLMGLTIADTDNPVEALRAIRGFDQCIACAVHIVTPKGKVKKFVMPF